MANPFTDHPHAVGESYFDHLGQASKIGGQMLAGGLACLLHGLFPFLFTTTGSTVILRLASRCAQRRAMMAAAEPSAASPQAAASPMARPS